MHKQKFEFRVGGIVVTKNNGEPNYLLLKNKNKGNWEFPKGYPGHTLEGDTESLKDTVIREIIEETGISKAQLKILRRMEQLDYEDDDFHERVYLYLVESKTKDVKTKLPHAWLNYNQLKKRMESKNSIQPFEEAEHYLGT